LMQQLEAALTSGACPALQVLKIHGCLLNDDQLKCLASAVRANAVRGLRELEIGSGSGEGAVGIEKLMVAVEAGSCPRLTSLSLSSFRISEGASQALARAVRAGAIPGLEMVRLYYCPSGPGVLAAVVEALAEGWCPHLQAVDLRSANVTEGELLPLLRAVGEGRLGKVRSLDFGEHQIAGAGMQALIEAMAGGQRIEELSIKRCPLSEQDFLRLVSRCGAAPLPTSGEGAGDSPPCDGRSRSYVARAGGG
jgi:hypothetical protein